MSGLYLTAASQSKVKCDGRSSQSAGLVCVGGLLLFDLVVTAKRQTKQF
jgi:hypothetical protein